MTRLNWLTLTAASVVAVALVVALPGVAASTAGSAPAINPDDDFAPMFERLKTLVGTWDEQEYGRVVEYHLTGEGSALIEEFVGDPPMSSVYHMDGGELDSAARSLRKTRYGARRGISQPSRHCRRRYRATCAAVSFLPPSALALPGQIA